MSVCECVCVCVQRQCRHFKSGQATANKGSLVHVGWGLYNRQCAAVKLLVESLSMQLYKNKYNSELFKHL